MERPRHDAHSTRPFAGVSRPWVDGVQDRWDAAGRRFSTDELTRIRRAAKALPPHMTGVPSVSSPAYAHRTTTDLLDVLDHDTEAGWDLVVRVLSVGAP